MVSYPINIPSAPSIKTLKMEMASAVSFASSPFTGHQYVNTFSGEWWEATVTLPLMTREESEEWISFLGLLRGPTGTFLMGDPAGATARGVATGTPLVDGADQTGATLNIKGFSTGVTNILKAGDYIQIGTNLHKVLADVDSDVSGDTTVEIFPRIRTAYADSASIIVSNTKGLWRLKPGRSTWTSDESNMVSMSFDIQEAF